MDHKGELKMARRELHPAPGMSPEIGLYFSGMEEVRDQVRLAISDVSDELVGRSAFQGAHSLGALALHIGEAEWWWIHCVVSGHKLTVDDRRAPYWDVLKHPESFARKGYSAEFCMREVDKLRSQTREVLSSFSDQDLERIFSFDRRGTQERSLRWILHHLIDHEAQHKGQILMLRRLLGLKSIEVMD
jgi:uncharacterized damage-inducible protein DinB